MFYVKCRNALTFLSMSMFVGGMSVFQVGTVVAEKTPPQEHQTHAHQVGMNSQSPGWAEKLKGQTIVEDAMEGRAERAALVEQQHNRLMQQMEKEMDPSAPSMMHSGPH